MCSLRFENNLPSSEGVRFASISKKTLLSKLSFAFVSLALPLLLPYPAAMSLTKLSLGGNNLFMTSLFPPRESLVSDIPARDGNIEKLFLRCRLDRLPKPGKNQYSAYLSFNYKLSHKKCDTFPLKEISSVRLDTG